MIKQFKNLTNAEIELLLKAPVLVSVLASSGDHEISRAERVDAIKLAHLKTFTADPLLIPYYNEVEKSFRSNFESIVKKYGPFDAEKREALSNEIVELNKIIRKLDKPFGQTLLRSLAKYAKHVKKSDKTIIENFIFPIPIHGLVD